MTRNFLMRCLWVVAPRFWTAFSTAQIRSLSLFKPSWNFKNSEEKSDFMSSQLNCCSYCSWCCSSYKPGSSSIESLSENSLSGMEVWVTEVGRTSPGCQLLFLKHCLGMKFYYKNFWHFPVDVDNRILKVVWAFVETMSCEPSRAFLGQVNC